MDFWRIYQEAENEMFNQIYLKAHFKEDNVKNYVKSLHDDVLKDGVPDHKNAKYSYIEFNKERLDSIRGVQGWDISGKNKCNVISGSHDTEVLSII